MNAILRYPGGKWRIADWIVGHFPAHRVYCEPFFGSGAEEVAISFGKPESYVKGCDERGSGKWADYLNQKSKMKGG